MTSRKKIAVKLTPRQIAAAEEACDSYGNLMDIPAAQQRSTRQAADALRKSFDESKEPWPW